MSETEHMEREGTRPPWYQAPVLVVILDDQERIVEINSLVVSITGWKERQILGRPFSGIFHPSIENRETCSIPDPSFLTPNLPFEMRFTTRWGEEKIVLWAGRQIQDEGRESRLLLMGMDITQRSQEKRKCLKIQERVSLGKREWRTIFDGITDMLMILKPNFTIRKTNRATSILLGMPLEQILGKKCGDLCQAGKGFPSSCPVARSVKMKLPLSGEVYCDPIGKHLLVTTYPILDSRGKVISIIAYHKDITKLRQTQEELEKTNSLLRALIDSSESAVLMTDETGKVVITNRKFYELFGIKETISLKSRENIQDIMGQIIRNPEDFNRKFRFIQAHRMEHITDEIEVATQSEEKTLLRQTVPVTDNKGNFIGQLELFADITKLKRNLIEASHTEKLVALGEMVAGVAHELNNPLATISGFSQLILLKKDLQEEIRQDVEKIASEGERARRIIENLLTFSRVKEPEMTDVSLPEIMENTLDLMAYELRDANISIVKRYDNNLPLVRGNPTQFQQVFLNILKNAIYELKKINQDRILTLIMKKRETWIEIRIKDNGPGIARENLKRIFEPFFTTKPPGQGTGLGLSVTFGIIHQHGGTIYARNRASGGAEFIIRLPVATPAMEPPSPETPHPMEEPLTGRVLVVDDEDFVLELLRRFFEREGMKVTTACNGEKATSFLKEPFDLIVLDLVMPRKTGDKVFEELKDQGNPNAERVLFLTGDSVDAATLSFLKASGRPYLFKPFKLDDLKQKALEILKGSS